jgi:hypothetical protein
MTDHNSKKAKKDTSVAWKFLFVSVVAYFMAWVCSELTGISFALWWILIMAMAIIDGIVWHKLISRPARDLYSGYMYGQYVDTKKPEEKTQ